ncbi:MAG: hypothetical protein M3R72_10525 [Bacteroidota bacterium]|nr:hypothetical protein [Bacteroidota bacterium]
MKLKDRNTGTVKSNPVLTKWAVYAKGIAVKVASYLEAKAERLSHSAKRVWLIGFCAVGVLCSFGVIAYSFINIAPSLQNHTIQLPIHLSQLPSASLTGDSIISALQYQRIQRFEHYLKRQQQDVSGRSLYDSLLKARPHFMDSLRLIDSIFLSQ